MPSCPTLEWIGSTVEPELAVRARWSVSAFVAGIESTGGTDQPDVVAPDQLLEGDLIPDPQAGEQAAWSITTPGVAMGNGFVTPSLLARQER